MNLNPPKTEMLASFATINPPEITHIEINSEDVSEVKSNKIAKYYIHNKRLLDDNKDFHQVCNEGTLYSE